MTTVMMIIIKVARAVTKCALTETNILYTDGHTAGYADTQTDGKTFISRGYDKTYKLLFFGVTSNSSDFKPAIF